MTEQRATHDGRFARRRAKRQDVLQGEDATQELARAYQGDRAAATERFRASSERSAYGMTPVGSWGDSFGAFWSGFGGDFGGGDGGGGC